MARANSIRKYRITRAGMAKRQNQTKELLVGNLFLLLGSLLLAFKRLV